MPYIASTLTCNQKYACFHRGGDGFLTEIEDKSVLVKGGFGLANHNFVTPTGATLTPVTDAQLAFLEQHSQFLEHQEKGFVKIIKSSNADGDKAASGMTLGDKSQPLNPQMYKKKDDQNPDVLSVNTGRVRS
jgi:NAD kinase